MNPRRVTGLVSLCAVLLMIGTAMTAAAQGTYAPLPTGAPIEPDPWLGFNVTKDYQRTGWSAQNFLDNNNVLRSLPADVDVRVAEPWSIDPTKTYTPGLIQENQLAAGLAPQPDVTIEASHRLAAAISGDRATATRYGNEGRVTPHTDKGAAAWQILRNRLGF